MRSIFVIPLGMLAGAVGAFLSSRFAAKEPALTSPPPATSFSPARLAGSDPNLLPRLGAVETELALLRQKQAATAVSQKGEPASVADEMKERARIRTEQYEKDLEILSNTIAEHEREPFDARWAAPLEDNISHSIEKALSHQRPSQVKDVDCRSKTCIATLTFASQDDAMTERDQLTKGSVAGCSGTSTTLEPPTDAGSYNVRVIYYCR